MHYSLDNIGRGISLLDKIAISVCTGKFLYKLELLGSAKPLTTGMSEGYKNLSWESLLGIESRLGMTNRGPRGRFVYTYLTFMIYSFSCFSDESLIFCIARNLYLSNDRRSFGYIHKVVQNVIQLKKTKASEK